MAPVLTAITDRVHFVHTDLVNWTLVTGRGGDGDGDGVMLIDAGFPGNRADVIASLGQLGFGVQDVRAILLTHAHIDHFGSAIWFAREHGTPVYCHADEVGHSKREYLEQASPVDIAAHVWQPKWLRWSASIIGKGALTRAGIPTTAPLTEDIAARLPGGPEVNPDAGPHRRALLLRRGRSVGRRRRADHRSPVGAQPGTAAAPLAVQPR